MLSLLAAAALQAAVSGESEAWIERAASRARPLAECRVGPDCDAKWLRAQQWVSENSRFALLRSTDDLILTHGAIYANTDPSIVVVLDPPANGIRTIRFRAWCGNFFICAPSPRSLRRLFLQALRDATPQTLP